jgi:hypothetical protein
MFDDESLGNLVGSLGLLRHDVSDQVRIDRIRLLEEPDRPPQQTPVEAAFKKVLRAA